MKSIVDLEDYQFPQHRAHTDLRPDIVCWDEDQKKIVFVELTVCFETNFKAVADRKQEKYLDLAATAESAGYSADIIIIEFGSRGLPHSASFESLATTFNVPKRAMKKIQIQLARIAIIHSHRVWCSRNRQTL